MFLAAYRSAARWEDGFSMLRRLREDVRTLGDALAAEVRLWLLAAPGWAPEAEVAVNQVRPARYRSPRHRIPFFAVFSGGTN